MKVPAFKLGLPQRLAALLLVLFLAQCVWVISHQQLSTDDYRFARCGREMWERPSPLAGYFTSCGNLNGDGTFAYRVAGLPLTAQRLVLLAADKLRKPENRLYTAGSLNGSTWEARHELSSVKYLMHLPFVFFASGSAAASGGSRAASSATRADSSRSASTASARPIVRYAVTPNNDVLAMWGLYGLVYTAIGVAHAMQGPRRKWTPRIAAAYARARPHGRRASAGGDRRLHRRDHLHDVPRRTPPQLRHADPHLLRARRTRSCSLPPMPSASPSFSYVFTGGSARFWFSLDSVRGFFTDPANASLIRGALAIAAVLYLVVPPHAATSATPRRC